MLTMEKNILGSLTARRNYADLCGMKNREIKHTVVAKNIACTGKSVSREKHDGLFGYNGCKSGYISSDSR